jgi:hypothetical protein
MICGGIRRAARTKQPANARAINEPPRFADTALNFVYTNAEWP